MRRLVPLILAVAVLVGCSGRANDPMGNPAAVTSSPASGPSADKTLCRLLTADDFIAAGLSASAPKITRKTAVMAVCSYSNGLELEVTLSSAPGDAAKQFDTMLGAAGIAPPELNLVAGADASAFTTLIAVKRAVVIVRNGKVTYLVTIPESTPQARTTLIGLATVALGRTSDLA